MIITMEVLDRPRITFAANPGNYPQLAPFKKAHSPPALEQQSNKRQRKASASIDIMTCPHVTDHKKKVSTASIFITSPEEVSSSNVGKLECDPFTITTTLNSANLRRVDPKSLKRKGDSKEASVESNVAKSQREQSEELLNIINSFGNKKLKKTDVSNINSSTSTKTSLGDTTISSSLPRNSKDNSKIINVSDSCEISLKPCNKSPPAAVVRKASDCETSDQPPSSSATKAKQKALGTNANAHNTKLGTKPTDRLNNKTQVEKPLLKSPQQRLSIGSNKIANQKSRKVSSPAEKKKSRALSPSAPPAPPAEAEAGGSSSAGKKSLTMSNSEVIRRLRNELVNKGGLSGSGNKENNSSKSRSNSLIDSEMRARYGSIGTAKRPSISILQNNSAFMEQIRSRNNSLTNGELRTRNNSLTSVINFRPGSSRSNSIVDANNPLSKSRKNSQSASKSKPASAPTSHARPWVRKASAAASHKDASKRTNKRMGKTTTVQTRTFQKDGKWLEETVETTVVENKDGTRTTTKTTTKHLPGPPASADSHQRSRSSSSSRSPSPQRQSAKQKTLTKEPSSGGLLSRLRGKAKVSTSSSSSDEEMMKTLDDVDKSFAKDVMAAINEKRTRHGVKALKRSDKLTQEAVSWARHLASQDKMQHKQDKNYGENIYKLTANLPVDKSVASGQQIVDQWYSEVDKHKFGQEPTGAKLESGHFSQMVWKDTKDLGVGIALSNTKRNIYVVAFFSPKGNWMGEFATHVPPVGGFTSDSKLSGLASKLQRAAVASSSSSDEEEDFANGVLKSHNVYREKHGVPPLKLNKKLNKVAEDWAKTIAKRDRMEHRPNNEYGENIFAKWNSKPNHMIQGHEAVESWYSEIKDHSFGREPASLATGHFTQVVWRDSTDLGVGLARNQSSGKLYVVCNYEPAGNFVGQFAQKVPRPLKK